MSNSPSFVANYLLLYSERKKELASHGAEPYRSPRTHRQAPPPPHQHLLTVLQKVSYPFCRRRQGRGGIRTWTLYTSVSHALFLFPFFLNMLQKNSLGRGER